MGVNAIIFVFAAIIVLVVGVVILNVASLWLQALFSKAEISIFQLIGMKMRKVPPRVLVEARILSVKAGMAIDTNLLEAHYLSGGNVLRVVQSIIAAS